MNDNIEIEIPADIEGYFLLKCPSCGEKFMMTVKDINDESTIDIWCPNCGLKHENYLDEDINEFMQQMFENQGIEMLNAFSRNLEKSCGNKEGLEFKVSSEIKNNVKVPVGRKIGDFEKKKYLCCGKFAKVSSIKKFEGMYCPFCGELIDGD